MLRKNGDLGSQPLDDLATQPPIVTSFPAASPLAGHVQGALNDLAFGSAKFARTTTVDRIELARKCLRGVFVTATLWVDAACEAKGISAGSPSRAEEITSGPMIVARKLRLIIQSLSDIDKYGQPRLPGRLRTGIDGQLQVPVAPVQGLFDPIIFPLFKAHAWMRQGVTKDNLFGYLECRSVQSEAPIALVLGAGNVSAIPATDVFSKLFCEGRVVLLKMHPVNAYLGPIFQRAFAPLIDAGFLRIIYGGADVGAQAICDERVDCVHITGSVDTHDNIVWGPVGPERQRRIDNDAPILTKPITSELGSVSPWIVVPGNYSHRQLRFQAENIAASIVNNASFNCAATRVLITPKKWAYRETLVDALEQILAATPTRKAYYPGAVERYRHFTGREPEVDPRGTLPWTLLRNVDPEEPTELFCRESFVSVCVEVSLDGDTEAEFLERAVDFANEKLWGTLCAAVTVSPRYRAQRKDELILQRCLARLRYGCVGINQWPGLMYCLVSPPWGGYPGSELADVQSGAGWAHNTFMLSKVEKTVLDGPLTVLPKPLWFPSHGNPEPAAWAALDLYRDPSIWRLTKLFYEATTGHFARSKHANN